MSTLSTRIEALPQELKDNIFDLACPPIEEANNILIDESYQRPLQLSLTAPLRAEYARKYFTASTFAFSNPSLGTKWLASLPKTHLELLKHIDYDPLLPATRPGQGGLEFMPICAEQMKFATLKRLIAKAISGWQPEQEVLKVRMRFWATSGEWSVWSSDPVDTMLGVSGWGMGGLYRQP